MIEIYSKPSCGYCNIAKRAMRDLDMEYKEYIVGKDSSKEEIEERVKSLGLNITIKTVPQIFKDDKYIGGCEEFLREVGKTIQDYR